MDEYIKRSEVIDLVEKAIKKCSTEKTTKGVLVCAHLRTAVMGLRSADVAPRAEWIRVEERLPEKSCEYLCVSRTGVIYLMQYSHRYKAFNATDDEDGDRWKLGSITHWMPLPEPPNMKGDAE